MKNLVLAMMTVPLLFLGTACNKSAIGGAAVGAGAAGAAYEYQNKQAMDDLKEQYRTGQITREEYERRKQEIESKSLVY